MSSNSRFTLSDKRQVENILAFYRIFLHYCKVKLTILSGYSRLSFMRNYVIIDILICLEGNSDRYVIIRSFCNTIHPVSDRHRTFSQVRRQDKRRKSNRDGGYDHFLLSGTDGVCVQPCRNQGGYKVHGRFDGGGRRGAVGRNYLEEKSAALVFPCVGHRLHRCAGCGCARSFDAYVYAGAAPELSEYRPCKSL